MVVGMPPLQDLQVQWFVMAMRRLRQRRQQEDGCANGRLLLRESHRVAVSLARGVQGFSAFVTKGRDRDRAGMTMICCTALTIAPRRDLKRRVC